VWRIATAPIATPTERSRPGRGPAVAVAATLAALSLGGALAVWAVLGDRSAAVDPGALGIANGPAGAARVAPTSFGSVAVVAVQRSPGAHTGGHGGRHHAELGVEVTVTNALGHAIRFSPGQFRLGVAGRGTTITPARASAGPGAVAPCSTRTAHVAFIVPRRSDRWFVEIDDAGGRQPVRIAIAVDKE